MKSIALLPAAVMALTPAAIAGPYANVETNAGWTGNTYDGQTTEVHGGYENALGEDASWYIQAGPALVGSSGESLERRWSGKTGLGVDVTDRFGVYGEVSAITAGEDLDTDGVGVGAKLGAKYKF